MRSQKLDAGQGLERLVAYVLFTSVLLENVVSPGLFFDLLHAPFPKMIKKKTLFKAIWPAI
jgi:hypothetical protein